MQTTMIYSPYSHSDMLQSTRMVGDSQKIISNVSSKLLLIYALLPRTCKDSSQKVRVHMHHVHRDAHRFCFRLSTFNFHLQLSRPQYLVNCQRFSRVPIAAKKANSIAHPCKMSSEERAEIFAGDPDETTETKPFKFVTGMCCFFSFPFSHSCGVVEPLNHHHHLEYLRIEALEY